MARLGALRKLDLDHPDLLVRDRFTETLGVERAVLGAATKIAGADLPDQVATWLEVVTRHTALTRVVGETAKLRATVERQHRAIGQRAETHRRDIQVRSRIWLAAIRTAKPDPRFLVQLLDRCQRVAGPLVADAVDITLGAERTGFELALGALVHQRPELTLDRKGIEVGFDQVLLQLRPDTLDQIAAMADERKVLQDRVLVLQRITQAQQEQRHQQRQQPQYRWPNHPDQGHHHEQQGRDTVKPVAYHSGGPEEQSRIVATDRPNTRTLAWRQLPDAFRQGRNPSANTAPDQVTASDHLL